MHATDPPAAAGLADWIRLVHSPGVGEQAVRALIDQFASPAAVFGASLAALRASVGEAAAHSLRGPLAPEIAERQARTAAWLAEPRHHLLTLTDPRYPDTLKQVGAPPPLLYVDGDPAWLRMPALAIVGSRNASLQGCHDAEQFARAFADSGLTVVSGLALGIDAAAHRGALGGVGATVAVVGTGADLVYPAANRALAARIAAHGCIVSQFGLGTPPRAANFPSRNRILSALASGVLVVEAAARSGSLITAHLAAAQGREVFAIPGSIHAALSKGCHQLIREGATLVESAADVLAVMAKSQLLTMSVARAAAEAPPAEAEEEVALLPALGYTPVDADTLAQRSGLATGPLAAALLALELSGELERLPGGLFRRLKRGVERATLVSGRT